jgi:hypothetical protein
MELFHPYKKLLENVWRKPEFFYTFFAPLAHSFHPGSGVMPKPKLREIEMYITTLRVVWGEMRTKFLDLAQFLPPPLSNHFRNIMMILEFFIPIVSVICS